MTDKKFKFTVDRKRWNRGGSHEAALLNQHGMCCLGFAALTCGYSEEDIKDTQTPEELVNDLLRKGEGLQNSNYWFDGLIFEKHSFENDPVHFDSSVLCDQIMECNDDEEISDEEREKELTELFGKINVEVEFVG